MKYWRSTASLMTSTRLRSSSSSCVSAGCLARHQNCTLSSAAPTISTITDTVMDSRGAEGEGVAEVCCKPWESFKEKWKGGIETILLQFGKEKRIDLGQFHFNWERKRTALCRPPPPPSAPSPTPLWIAWGRRGRGWPRSVVNLGRSGKGKKWIEKILLQLGKEKMKN